MASKRKGYLVGLPLFNRKDRRIGGMKYWTICVLVVLVACDSTRPTEPLESSKMMGTVQEICPLDIVGQWEGQWFDWDDQSDNLNHEWFSGHIVQFCEDGTWTNIKGFSGTWSLDDNALTIAHKITNSTGLVFVARPRVGDSSDAGERLYLNLALDQLVELEFILLGTVKTDDRFAPLDQRYRLFFRKISG